MAVDFAEELGLEPTALHEVAQANLAYIDQWLQRSWPESSAGPLPQIVTIEAQGGDSRSLDPTVDPALLDPYFGVSESVRLHLVAGCTAYAAVLESLVDQNAGRELFGRAAGYYRDLDSSFFFSCAALAGRQFTGYRWSLLEDPRTEPHHTLIGLALASVMDLSNELRLADIASRWASEWGTDWDRPVGDAGFPLGSFAHALAPILAHRELLPEANRTTSALRPLLEAAADHVALMQRVEDRWSEIAWEAPPLDPDVLAVCALSLVAFGGKSALSADVAGSVPLRVASALLGTEATDGARD